MLFGTSGIRGIYGKDVDEKLAMRIANLFADQDVIIARDTRTTGEALAFAAISGITGRGKNANYIGITPTPTLALATKKHKCKGIMITASHNPPEYNGLKFYNNGNEIGRKAETELEHAYANQNAIFTEWNKVGKRLEDYDVVEDHIRLIKKTVNMREVSARKPRVIVDCNGAGAVITPGMLEQLGCDVIAINRQLSGFTRASEPNSENLKLLGEKVRELQADLGVGHDGDADRAVVVDENGEVLPLDVQLAIMIENEIRKKAKNGKKTKVVSTVEASLCVREAAEKNNAEITITPVGSNFVAEVMAKENAIFGGEPCGEYIFSDGINVPDGVLTAAKFVEIFCERGKLSLLKKTYRPNSIIREKFACDNSMKYKIVEEIKSQIKVEPEMKMRTDDGIRIDEKDGWFLVRASGTEPYIRLTMEYKNQDKLNKKAAEIREIINKVRQQ